MLQLQRLCVGLDGVLQLEALEFVLVLALLLSGGAVPGDERTTECQAVFVQGGPNSRFESKHDVLVGFQTSHG